MEEKIIVKNIYEPISKCFTMKIIYNEQLLLCSDNEVIYVMISFIKDSLLIF